MPPEDVKLRKATRLRVVDDARHSLEEAILSGHMRPGERLAETWIASELGVSRTTVREALLMLERQGLVITIPRRGTFVTRLSLQDALDISYTRALLEGFAVSIGYLRLNKQIFAELEVCIEQMGRCTLPFDIPRLIQIDAGFHNPLIECAGSPRLTELWRSLNGGVGAMMLRSIEMRQADIQFVMQMHRELVDQLRTGDRDQAVKAVMVHYLAPDHLESQTGQQALAIATLTAELYKNQMTGAETEGPARDGT